MEHGQARLLASAAVDGPLTKEQERELAVHLVACRECKHFFEEAGRISPALAALSDAAPTEVAVAKSVQRAVTVLRGDADPGPLPTHDIHRVRTVPSPAVGPPSPAQRPGDGRPGEGGPATGMRLAPAGHTPPEPVAPEETDDPAGAAPPDAPVESPLAPATGGSPAARAPERAGHDDDTIIQPAVRFVDAAARGAEAPRAQPIGRDGPDDDGTDSPLGLEDLPELGVSRRERRARRRETSSRRRALPWVLGIISTLVLAGIAVGLISQQDAVRQALGPNLPEPAEVRSGVESAFDGVSSFESSYRITRLGLYRQPDTQRVLYVFTNATIRGRLVYEGPDALRDEQTIEVQGRSTSNTVLLRGTDIRILGERDGGRTLQIQTNAPLGPPEAPVTGRLGSLEEAIGAPIRLLSAAADLEVVEKTTYEEQDVYRVGFSVEPSEFTRADRIDMLVDARTFVPLFVERSIGRANATVLGPPELLNKDAIDARFGERDRIRTEVVELERVTIDEAVLPGEFVITPPAGVDEESKDAKWVRVSRAELSDRLPFRPLLPRTLPMGFRDSGYAVSGGAPAAWGPRGAFPKPDGLMQAQYTDGPTTIVVTQRAIRENKDRVKGSPFPSGALPVQTREIIRSGFRFTYGISAETPPHLFGFVGDVHVVVSGYVPEADLVKLAVAVAQGGAPAATSDPESTSGTSADPSASEEPDPADAPAGAGGRSSPQPTRD